MGDKHMHTVISSFKDPATAQRAMDRLVEAGFAREDMHMQHYVPTGQGGMDRTDWEGMEREVAVDPGVLESVGRFFTSLFGKDNPSVNADAYSQAVARGESVVVLDADDEQQANRAAKILDEEGGKDRNIVPRSSEKRLRSMGAEV